MTSPNVNSTIVACRVHAMSCGLRPSTTTLVPRRRRHRATPRIGIFRKLSNCSPFLFSSLSYMQESFNCGGKKRDEDMRKTAKLVTNFSPLHVERNEILDVIVKMGYSF